MEKYEYVGVSTKDYNFLKLEYRKAIYENE